MKSFRKVFPPRSRNCHSKHLPVPNKGPHPLPKDPHPFYIPSRRRRSGGRVASSGDECRNRVHRSLSLYGREASERPPVNCLSLCGGLEAIKSASIAAKQPSRPLDRRGMKWGSLIGMNVVSSRGGRNLFIGHLAVASNRFMFHFENY